MGSEERAIGRGDVWERKTGEEETLCEEIDTCEVAEERPEQYDQAHLRKSAVGIYLVGSCHRNTRHLHEACLV